MFGDFFGIVLIGVGTVVVLNHLDSKLGIRIPLLTKAARYVSDAVVSIFTKLVG